MLTRKQQELLLFIHNRLNEGGVSPSFDEMKEAVGLKSKSGIHRLVSGLEERGFIRRLKHRARALEVLKLPEGLISTATATVITPDFSKKKQENKESVSLPLYGRIAAGLPIEALRDESEFIDIPSNLVSGGEYYALEVDGESMINAGILDGDIVIIERCDHVSNGTICVALVDGAEVTLKRYRQSGNIVALEAENPNFETRMLPIEQVDVQGRLAALYRRY